MCIRDRLRGAHRCQRHGHVAGVLDLWTGTTQGHVGDLPGDRHYRDVRRQRDIPASASPHALGAPGSSSYAWEQGRNWTRWRRLAYPLEDLSLIHISEPTRLLSISYAVFCLKKKK